MGPSTVLTNENEERITDLKSEERKTKKAEKELTEKHINDVNKMKK